MKFEIYGDKVNITETERAMIEEKLSFLQKYLLIDPNLKARLAVKTYPTDLKVEVTIPTKVGILRSEVTNADFNQAVDLAIEKLEDQLRRQKSRLSRRHKDSLAETFITEDEELAKSDEVVRTKNIAAEEMTLDDAIMKMEMLGHSFFIYKDSDAEKIAVVYERHDGGYGLIEVDE
ncbi:MAG: ribosome-associated translation inhibitor RaiA [Erysipelotrichaceae bacterium]|nr:ribosome-associated translation inhibitor RaiA [Erysipelotrichaceae bacterium]